MDGVILGAEITVGFAITLFLLIGVVQSIRMFGDGAAFTMSLWEKLYGLFTLLAIIGAGAYFVISLR
jgi:hypothetical protein